MAHESDGPDAMMPDDATSLTGARPFWPLAPIPAPESVPVLPSPPADGQPAAQCDSFGNSGICCTDFGRMRRPMQRILVLKLDHFGDFVIGLPALRTLRDTFPSAHIRLICGTWNEASATASGLVDEVRCFNFFPEHPHGATPQQKPPLWQFDKAAAGAFGLAIDLRADHDTRHLLGRVNAALRCGIGSVMRFPFLDIALPDEHENRGIAGDAVGHCMFLSPGQFNSLLPVKTPMHHYGPFTAGELVQGPLVACPPGKLRAEVQLSVRGHVPGLLPYAVQIEAAGDGGQVLARKVFGRGSMLRLRRPPVVLEFDNPTAWSRFAFNVYVTGRPSRGTVRFSGVTVGQRESGPAARFRPSELHIGEKLTLLVALVQARTADLYRPLLSHSTAEPDDPRLRRTPGQLRIAVAPFSNSSIRDWPVDYYVELIAMLLERLSCQVVMLGTPRQQPQSQAIIDRVRSPLLINLVGQTTWDRVETILRSSDLVICNNSGIAHQAAAVGARVLAIYSGSHQPREWGPRGMRAQAITHQVPCSPCGFERLAECPADHACMRLLTPQHVFARMRAMLAPDYDARTADAPALTQSLAVL